MDLKSGTASEVLRLKFRSIYPLTADEITALERACTRSYSLARNQDVVREGDRPDSCNLLIDGIVCRYKILPDGQRQILSFQFPGDLFDSQSFLLDAMDHGIATISPCTIATIPHAAMAVLTSEHPRLGRALWKDTLVDAAIFREWLTNVARRSAYQRIAHLFCETFIRVRAIGLARGDTIDWPITQRDIGDALGLTVVHVNRTLRDMRSAHIISLQSSTLRILDWVALADAAQFDPAYLQIQAAA